MIVALNTLVLLILALFVYWLYKRNGSLLQLGILFSIILALDYPFRIMTIYFFPQDGRPQYPGLAGLDSLKHLSLLQIPGILTFCVGYVLIDRRSKGHPLLQSSLLNPSQTDFMLLVFVYGISLLGKSYKILTGNYVSFIVGKVDDRWANGMENIHMLGWLVFAGIWFLYFAGKIRSPIRVTFFVIVNLIELAYQVIQGSKTFLLLPAYVLLLAYYYQKRRIPYLGIALTVLFAILFVFPFVAAYRESFYSTYKEIPSFNELEATQTIQKSYAEAKDEGKTFKEKTFFVLSRFEGADELYNMVYMVPYVLPYQKGKDFMTVFYAFVPRLIWPSKPRISPGAEYGEAVGSITSVTPYPLGEMYWNYGITGIAVGMFIWGLVLAMIMSIFDFFFRKYPDARLYTVSVFLSQVYWLTSGEVPLSMIVASLPKQLLLSVAVYLFAINLARQGHRTAQAPI